MRKAILTMHMKSSHIEIMFETNHQLKKSVKQRTNVQQVLLKISFPP